MISNVLWLVGLCLVAVEITWVSGANEDIIIYPEKTTNNTVHLGAVFPMHNFSTTEEEDYLIHRCDSALVSDFYEKIFWKKAAKYLTSLV